MPFDATLAAIRFGSGLSPLITPPYTVDAIMAEIDRPFPYPLASFDNTTPSIRDFQQASRARNLARGTPTAETEEEAFRAVRKAANDIYDQTFRSLLARQVGADVGFKARLATFFADHFTVKNRNTAQRHVVAAYSEDAIAPHVNGYFKDMLRAVVTHPMMLLYLQQAQSSGPNSPAGLRRNRGINENLARELLELHTLGVAGNYSQTDVRELAELLTGLTYNGQRGFFYNIQMAEPGAEKVLGVQYDAADGLQNVLDALDDLADHPQTAAHIARKIAIEFVADDPDASLVSAMTDAFQTSGGYLPNVYAAMLAHDAAWDDNLQKIKSPQRFMTSAMRALGVTGDAVNTASGRDTRGLFLRPLRVMGQPWKRPNGPDGWPDDSKAWITAQGMAGRINWAMRVPRRLLDNRVPDPREFVHTALSGFAGQDVIFAASAAEVREEGIGLILSSPAFQRS